MSARLAGWASGTARTLMASSLGDDEKEATMSLRPSRIHRIRKRDAWRQQFRLDDDACPGELARDLTTCR